MKKLIYTTLLFGISMNAIAGGSGWSPESIDPRLCVMITGSSNTSAGQLSYKTQEPTCMQGINEGKVKGVNTSGTVKYKDGSRTNFSGFVGPNHWVPILTDANKVNSVGIESVDYTTSWSK
ncbi:hypothetical protein G3797_003680 [Salmonella enterica subsp. enterica serovar Virchow]|uniref:hypothetical protein n=1 Tax=Salmonella enterica TaxID=28901 RepID=UPI0009AD2BCD|nr:hypothetical protein [Salmonella enterica]EEJ6908679.1 hypothetical protein [Salmonella enterica subsp. enterica serovar Stanleyville]EEK8568130.1 hypothetical protein [Salmonella enterica subsp. enterica serovar Virchow]EHF8028663.1 hypothetical protein [Salmonella enterica subsp. enterica serovar Virchow]